MPPVATPASAGESCPSPAAAPMPQPDCFGACGAWRKSPPLHTFSGMQAPPGHIPPPAFSAGLPSRRGACTGTCRAPQSRCKARATASERRSSRPCPARPAEALRDDASQVLNGTATTPLGGNPVSPVQDESRRFFSGHGHLPFPVRAGRVRPAPASAPGRDLQATQGSSQFRTTIWPFSAGIRNKRHFRADRRLPGAGRALHSLQKTATTPGRVGSGCPDSLLPRGGPRQEGERRMTDSTVLNATGRARTEVLKVWLSKEEAEIRRRATSLGVSVAEFVRAATLGRRPPARRRGSAAGMDDLMKVAGRLDRTSGTLPAKSWNGSTGRCWTPSCASRSRPPDSSPRRPAKAGAGRGCDRQAPRQAIQPPDDGAGHRETDPLRPLAAPRHSRTGLRAGSAAGLRRMPLDA